MAYIPNAQDPSEPTENRTVESAALEFRTLKAEHVRGLRFPVSDPVDARGELPGVASRLGRLLVFNATTGKPEQGPLTADVVAGATSAAASAAAAAISETNAASSEAAAAASETLAYQWASNPEDLEVLPAEYSAYHWAQKAGAAANNAAADVINIINNLSSALDYGLIVNTPDNLVDMGEIA